MDHLVLTLDSQDQYHSDSEAGLAGALTHGARGTEGSGDVPDGFLGLAFHILQQSFQFSIIELVLDRVNRLEQKVNAEGIRLN